MPAEVNFHRDVLWSLPVLRRAVKIVSAALLICVALSTSAHAAPSNGDPVPPASVLRQIERLVPQRPGVIDVYALVVGGDGSERVFQREVAVVRTRLEERLQASGHVVTLVNNRGLPQPEATISSLEYVVQRLSERMDKGQDLLFLHLTSHGARDHSLVLAHPRQELNWLGKKELANILRRSGIRHRFIVISGCYSGGFIPDLANDNTVVVTASASTATSYGWGDKSEITNFSRVFYTQALTRSRPLTQVARLAVQYVHEDETRSRPAHSYPQVFIGTHMEDYLRQLDLQLSTNAPNTH